jgi:predicted RNA-binding Zn ribbon-like protein
MEPLWIEFVNSDWHDPLGRSPDRDLVDDPAWVSRFLARRDLPRVDPAATRTREALRELRSLLLGFVHTLVRDGPLTPQNLELLNLYLAGRPVTGRLEIEGEAVRLRLAPTAPGLDALLFAIAESFATFLVEGDPTRLKTCENPDCRWVFHDTSRSRTRRWCADSCGNLMKVRAFRRKARRKAGSRAAGERRKDGGEG